MYVHVCVFHFWFYRPTCEHGSRAGSRTIHTNPVALIYKSACREKCAPIIGAAAAELPSIVRRLGPTNNSGSHILSHNVCGSVHIGAVQSSVALQRCCYLRERASVGKLLHTCIYGVRQAERATLWFKVFFFSLSPPRENTLKHV